MRLQKYIAHCGIASRRKAEQMILDGLVKVNGKVCAELGVKVEPTDLVEINGEKIQPESKKVYLMLNKPVGYITSNEDQFDRKIVTELVKDYGERLYPVGRLDYNTSGLLILTNDGDLANKLMHPKHNITKKYVALIDKPFSKEISDVFKNGIEINGRKTMPARIKKLANASNSGSYCEIRISEGRNRQIRRLFEAAECNVIKLERIAIGEINLGDLEIGAYRKLSIEEINYLKSL